TPGRARSMLSVASTRQNCFWGCQRSLNATAYSRCSIDELTGMSAPPRWVEAFGSTQRDRARAAQRAQRTPWWCALGRSVDDEERSDGTRNLIRRRRSEEDEILAAELRRMAPSRRSSS